MLRELRKCPEKARNTVILFVDAMHLIHQTIPGKLWVRKGQRKMIPTGSGRKRLTILGALERGANRVIALTTEATCDALFTIAFFQMILKTYARKARIVIILDNGTYFHAKLVSAFVRATPIELWFLPSSSPNLNLIERFWKFSKGKLVKSRYHATFRGLQLATCHFFRNICKHRAELKTLLTDRFIILKGC